MSGGWSYFAKIQMEQNPLPMISLLLTMVMNAMGSILRR